VQAPEARHAVLRYTLPLRFPARVACKIIASSLNVSIYHPHPDPPPVYRGRGYLLISGTPSAYPSPLKGEGIILWTCFGVGCFRSVPEELSWSLSGTTECSLARIRSLKGEGILKGRIFNAHPLDCFDIARRVIQSNGRAEVAYAAFFPTSNSCARGVPNSERPGGVVCTACNIMY
jgi:hypothetical protein